MNTNLVSVIISLIFALIKYLEMKFITKEPRGFKLFFRDIVGVYVSCMSGFLLLNFIIPLTSESSLVPNVFVNDPDF